MLYVFHLLDKANALPLRESLRAAHRPYVRAVADRIAFAGPLVGDDGHTRVGSLLVIDFPDRAAAEAWLREEPFVKGGLFSSVQVHAFQNLWPQQTGFPPAEG